MEPATESAWCRYSLRLVRQAEDVPAIAGEPFSPAAAAACFHELFGSYEREVCGALFLNSAHRAIGYAVPFKGGLARASVEPRAFLQRALLANAAALVLFHNHLSGELEPSQEDVEFTRRMMLAGGLVGVLVLDHLILGEPPEYLSIVQEAGIARDLGVRVASECAAGIAPLLFPEIDRRKRVQPKYLHPETGETWSGRGHMADWLRRELEAGAELEDFLLHRKD